MARPVGTPTRGTTNPNRLRRCDRYLTGPLAHVLREAGPDPVVVDLGFGASAVTPLELYDRIRAVRPDVRVLGVEIDPERVASAQPHAHERLQFLRGGFEVPVPDGWAAPTIIRAANVLRQYDEAQVPDAWVLMGSRLAPGGRLVEGTCDELGRRGCWVTLDASGPRTFTVMVSVEHLERPSDVADRLPKCLIHRNVPGERIHDFLGELDRAFDEAAPFASLGRRQRWNEALRRVDGIVPDERRWRLGELTVPWERVAPLP